MQEPEAKDIAKKIEAMVDLLAPAHTGLRNAASEYAIKKAEYSKELGLTTMMLKAGKVMFLEGESIQNPPATTTDKVVKGICWESELAFLKAEASYKVAVSKIESIRAKLMGYQSIYKHLSKL